MIQIALQIPLLQVCNHTTAEAVQIIMGQVNKYLRAIVFEALNQIRSQCTHVHVETDIIGVHLKLPFFLK